MAAKKNSPERFEQHSKDDLVKREIIGIITLALAVFLFLGNTYEQSTGIIGGFIFGTLFNIFIGHGKLILPYFIGITGLLILFGRDFTREKTTVPGIFYGYLVYLIYLEVESGRTFSAFQLLPIAEHAGGIIGYLFAFLLHKIVGFSGLKIVLIASVFIAMMLIFNVTLAEAIAVLMFSVKKVVDFIRAIIFYKRPSTEEAKENPKAVQAKTEEIQADIEKKKKVVEPKIIEEVVVKKKKAVEEEKELDLDRAQRIDKFDDDFELPDLKLLADITVPRDNIKKVEEEIKLTIRKLEETLESFKVNARVVATSQGPSVTRYEIQPGFGVKVSKIVGLADDIALNLAARGVRIEAPIPGKSVVGIEIPNNIMQMVTMLPLARDEKFLYSSSPLFIALGKDLEGKSTYIDLTKMPHLLVAGATGSGKSVCINSIVISLLLRNTPSTVRFIMIDPKKVELSVYDDIPHLIAPVVTDPKKAAVTLRWCVREMERRYEELATLGVRNIDGFNEKIDELHIQKEKMNEEQQKEFFIPQKHTYIVVIIDELADLMLAAASEVETSIARISQMARAVGIHLVIATQRPSVDVITGLIKANVPSRIAFAVSSQIDSRTILDSMGAEKLLGKGDMLYKPVGSMQPTRAQGVYISDKEVHSIVKFVKSQGKPEYLQEVVNLKAEDLEDLKKSAESGANGGDFDEFYNEAREIVIQSKVASISYIQRKLRIGYNRAARIMEQLEEAGIVSSADADGKNRKVIV
ncbi:MAG: DNA translocase FtsK 4TM domain-containing protein [Candidatus Margulisbacteria bacterium]|nr:DNA translocase FtsK 4TM domain-containing protein [Candidatus Margulisiibacteriota bacterium]